MTRRLSEMQLRDLEYDVACVLNEVRDLRETVRPDWVPDARELLEEAAESLKEVDAELAADIQRFLAKG